MENDLSNNQQPKPNYEQQLKGIIQTMSSIMIPLILVSNIDISRILMAVAPSLIAIVFLVYDYYKYSTTKKPITANSNQYIVMVKNKAHSEDFRINQLFNDIESYVNETVMKKGMKSSIVENSIELKYIRNNYYTYEYNLKLPEQNTISFNFRGNTISLNKTIAENSNSRQSPVKIISVIADDFDTIQDF